MVRGGQCGEGTVGVRSSVLDTIVEDFVVEEWHGRPDTCSCHSKQWCGERLSKRGVKEQGYAVEAIGICHVRGLVKRLRHYDIDCTRTALRSVRQNLW